MFAIAEHNPGALHQKNKSLAGLSHQTLHEFAATPRKGLPEHVKKHKGMSSVHKSIKRGK